ncbi:MAG: NADH-quinone oxidoreductase subunit NuoF [Lachnospiraceae bacterium]|nr:NADH-quinone oxidoreductase subunit NuoF [Lachnospiraceae bacterium]
MKSINELLALKEKAQAQMGARCAGSDMTSIVVGMATCGIASGARPVLEEMQKKVEEEGLDTVMVTQTGCVGMCQYEPILEVYEPGKPKVTYIQMSPDKVDRIVQEHLKGGSVVEDFTLESIDKIKVDPDADNKHSLNDTVFQKNQRRIALRNCGYIDPESIDDYISTDGYQALNKVLTEMEPDEVIQTVLDSGLRGRGGAGFPTGLKWRFASGNRGQVQKFVCCNADEGDPGAFMDRSVLEGDPHVVLEAMAIAGYAIGSNQGYIYVRAEYPIAVKRLEIALNQAREYGVLGKDIFGTGFDFDISLRLGAGAFVCGEETALMTSIEGNRGEPRPRPPFPAVKGLFAKPTILNNVETYANIPQIILKGADWYSSVGTEKSKGTKVFALGGKINNTGLVEVPMGIPLRTVIEDIGGGVPNGKKFKAAQTGGPSGGCIPASLLDVPMDYESLGAIGSIIGSGGLIVMDEDNCMVDIAKFYLQFTADESCGKCTPCRVGTKRMLEILERITKGQGTLADIDKLEELAAYVKENSACGLGQTAPNPILSTIKHFRDEYEAHVVDKCCPAGVCKDLLQYRIDPDKCKGCTLCAKNCPAGAITGTVKEPHVIDQTKCIKCGVCKTNCKFDAIDTK